ncbi:MAG: site-specific integrase [Phycisphaerales bacterium]|jgi:integrase
MAVEKVGIYRKSLEPVPEHEDGRPIPRSQWPKKRRHRWIVRWYGSDGKRYGKVFETRKEAARHASQLQSRVCLGKADKPQKIPLKEFRLEHEHVMKGQVAYATLDDQSRALRLFEKYIGESFLLSKIKPRQAEAFIAHRLSSVPSVATVNKDIRTLQHIFNLEIEPRGYLADGQNPFIKLKQRKPTRKPIRYVGTDEYRELMDGAKKLWWQALVSVAYWSGLRRNEILNLTWADIDFENHRIHVQAKKETADLLAWEPKDHENRVVPMSEETGLLLVKMQAEAEESHPYIFISPGAWRGSRNAGKKEGGIRGLK